MCFIWWAKLLITAISILFIFLILGASFKGENRVARMVIFLAIFILFHVFVVSRFNLRNFDENSKSLRWINTVSRRIYRKSISAIFEDRWGEYFLDPQTGDTCRRATKEDLFPVYEEEKIEYESVCDTLFNKTFSKKGEYSSGILWCDIKRGDIIRVSLLSKKGFARFFVSPEKSICVSPNKNTANYSLQIEAPEGKGDFVYYVELSKDTKIKVSRIRRYQRIKKQNKK
jgi:hypothetical protein